MWQNEWKRSIAWKAEEYDEMAPKRAVEKGGRERDGNVLSRIFLKFQQFRHDEGAPWEFQGCTQALSAESSIHLLALHKIGKLFNAARCAVARPDMFAAATLILRS